MNENYDKYRDLFQPNKAILVVGEVNNGDDKPKIFPQEIMPLEDAPKKYTKQVHLRLHTAHLKPENLDSVQELAAAHPGRCPLFLCFMRPGGEIVFIETHEKFLRRPVARNCSRPWTNVSARKPITPRWTRRRPNARPANGSAAMAPRTEGNRPGPV